MITWMFIVGMILIFVGTGGLQHVGLGFICFAIGWPIMGVISIVIGIIGMVVTIVEKLS